MSTAAPLLFNWAPPRRRARALFYLLIASLLLHAFCFYLFQIVYPPTVALLPAPARLNLISSDNPEALPLLRWVEAEDPAASMATLRDPETKAPLPLLQHRPSYASHQPRLRSLPQRPPDLAVPSAGAVGPVYLPKLEANIATPTVAHPTTVLLGDQAVPPDAVPSKFSFQSSSAEVPANARFRVALDDSGKIRFCFLTESSRDPALDEQARRLLLLCHFPRMTGKADHSGWRWTSAIILWGNDIASRPAPSP